MLKKVTNFILDLFFPKKCLSCGKDGTYLCQNCLSKIEIIQNTLCPFCGKIMPNGAVCKKCEERYGLNHLIWAAPYHDPLVKNLIRAFKYQYVKELSLPLGELLIKSLKTFNFGPLTFNFVVVPIPLHKRKLRERDFNQAELLTQQVANYFSIPLEKDVLNRKKFTSPQAKIKDYRIRKETLKDVFEISKDFIKKCTSQNQNLLKDKIIILVDDVSTTGATLSEAAKVLKRAGAKEVWGLVVARG